MSRRGPSGWHFHAFGREILQAAGRSVEHPSISDERFCQRRPRADAAERRQLDTAFSAPPAFLEHRVDVEAVVPTLRQGLARAYLSPMPAPRRVRRPGIRRPGGAAAGPPGVRSRSPPPAGARPVPSCSSTRRPGCRPAQLEFALIAAPANRIFPSVTTINRCGWRLADAPGRVSESCRSTARLRRQPTSPPPLRCPAPVVERAVPAGRGKHREICCRRRGAAGCDRTARARARCQR